MKIKKIFIVAFSIFAFSQISFAQDSDSESGQEITFDSETIIKEEKNAFLHENDEKKHWFTAIGGMLFYNIGLSTYNRFVVGAAWAKVGPDEWNRFWERELKWDDDWYWTNFVLHPYQGTIYYNVSRGSNLNKLESFGVTVLGAAMWEYLCETNSPSINDMVYTTVGAFSLGEMLYRLSLEADEISKICGMLINPTRLWTELWTRQKPLGLTGKIEELSLRLDLGNAFGHTNLIGYSGDWQKTEVYPVFFSPRVNIVYGNPFGHDSNDPYSQFELEFAGAIGKGSGYGANCNYPVFDKNVFYRIQILSNGMLISRAPEKLNDLNKSTTVGFSMQYDFDWHSYYLLSSLAPGAAIKQKIDFEKSSLEWQAHLAYILLGTSDFYYLRRDFDETIVSKGKARQYNYNIGVETKLSAKFKNEKGSFLAANFRGYAMYDFYHQLQEFADGSAATHSGWDLVGILNLSAEYALNKTVRLGICDEIYAKYATYKTLDDVAQIVNTASVYLKLQGK